METKICPKCNRELSIETEFHKHSQSKDGLSSWCKDCKRKKDAEYYKSHKKEVLSRVQTYYGEHKDDKNAYATEYRKANPEKIITYRIENSEKIAEHQRKYSKTHREKINATRKRYFENNKNQVLTCNHAYRARKANLPSTLTKEQWEQAIEYFNGKCAYCGCKNTLTQDHFIPTTCGGEYTRNNIVPACGSCNSSKRDRDFFEWYPKQPFYSKKNGEVILGFLGKSEYFRN